MGAFKELYISAKPLISVGAKGLYYQVTTLTVATTAFVKILNVGAEALDKMGISSDAAIKALSGLYITYKVARMFGTVGQAAAALPPAAAEQPVRHAAGGRILPCELSAGQPAGQKGSLPGGQGGIPHRPVREKQAGD